ncbi:fimbrial protein YehD [Citrobacter sp. Marseille-Q6884]|uniref:fimbrial protein YehD n=1 Tax=Citrobacter sp. Marseille-Q6884 TaxID=2956786 RepID=UPI0021B2CE31|nr:fimbrial protein YehD [Citrobacter sp. Marseille-Q6884]
MKRSIISAAVLSAVFMSAGAFAANSDTGILNIVGTVVGTSCQFVSGNSSEDVVLNQVETNKLNGLTAGEIYTPIKEQTKHLKIYCPDIEEGKVLNITVKAPNLDENGVIGNTLNDGAKGVGFALRYKNKAVNHSSNSIAVEVGEFDSDKTYMIPLDVYYAKQSDTSVTSGDVNATVTLQAAYN